MDAAQAALLAAMLLVHRQDLGPEPLGAWLFCAGVAGIGTLDAFMLLSGRGQGGGRTPGGVSHE